MPVMQGPPGAETVIDGRRYLYFVGTGYLGLQGHADVIRAACEATRKYGIASATSRSGYGDTPPVLDVERLAGRFFGMDDAFYFATGYLSNDILATLAADAVDAVFVDELSHYCVFQAARLTARPVYTFQHLDPGDLADKLTRHLRPGQRPLVMSDGLFAALGAIAPVADYNAILLDRPGSTLLIDDAHALGVLGSRGRGSFEHAGLFDADVNSTLPSRGDAPAGRPGLLTCGTLSKALGGFGGIIPGSGWLIERIKATSEIYRGASAPPVPAAAASARALELVLDHPEMRTRLASNVRLLRTGLANLGLPVEDTPSPIISLTIGDAANMRRIQSELASRGVLIAYMSAYSGLGPQGALRIAVFATHTGAMIGRLLDETAALL